VVSRCTLGKPTRKVVVRVGVRNALSAGETRASSVCAGPGWMNGRLIASAAVRYPGGCFFLD
jgi:hypothetical protein